MIRPIEEQDRDIFLELAQEFWQTPAVHAPIPQSHHEATFRLVLQGTPFAAIHIFEDQAQPVGYGLLAFTHSNEMGGKVVWVEEIYIRPEFQNRGLGSEYLHFLHAKYDSEVAAFRLEIEPANEAAARLYAREGYQKMPYQEYYRDGEGSASCSR